MLRFLLSFLFVLFMLNSGAFAADEKKELTYDRVMKTKTIRCGYLPYEPFLIKDINSGKMSGFTVEYLEAVAQRNGLKIEWTGEVNIDQVAPALESGRFDSFCVPATPDNTWEKVFEFSAELGALPYYVYVAKDSSLTEEQLKTAKFVVIDGFALTGITSENFPQAQLLSLPQTTSPADMYNQLRFGKAQAHVNEGISAMNYMKNNPNVIRRYSDTPLAAVRMFLISRKGDKQMSDFLDKTFDSNSPENLSLMEGLKEKYGIAKDTFLTGNQCTQKIVTQKGWKLCTLNKD